MNPDARRHSVWPVRFLAAITLLSGLSAIVEVLSARFSRHFEALLPFNYETLSRNSGLFAGFALIYFSSRLLARKRLAWYIAFVGTAVIIVSHGLSIGNFWVLIIPSISLILLALYRDQFQVESEPITTAQGLQLLIISLVAALAYGTLGFYILLKRDFGHDFTLVESFIRTLREYTLLGNTDLVARTRQARWFLTSLDSFGIITLAFGIFSLFRPLNYRYGTLPAERERARRILKRYGRSAEDAFKLWPEDKAFFFGVDKDSFIAYRVASGVALVLGDPVGRPEVLADIIRAFQAYCRRHDWMVVFVYIGPDLLALYRGTGLRAFQIGEDAIVDLNVFTAETRHNKHFRGVRNKFERLGYVFEVHLPPQSPPLLREAATVTRSWLKSRDRSEHSFALGYHDRGYLARSPLYVLRDRHGRMVAFANAIKSYHPKRATIDLMRFESGGETGVMDYLLLCVLESLRDAGWQEFSLGLAPLSGLREGPDRTPEERILGRLAQTNIGGLSFQGLRRYKDKFRPVWEPRYLVHERGPSGLALAALALNKVSKPRAIDKL